MVNTDYYETDRDTPNLATGYTNFEDLGELDYEFRLGPPRNNSQILGVKGNPQGGAYSTVEDLLRFSLALNGHKLLSAKYTDLITGSKV